MAKQLTCADLAKSGTEHGEQRAFFFWTVLNRANYPDTEWMYAIPNGGGRTAAQGGMLKAEGVKSGVADVCLPVPVGMYAGLYIEMKKKDGVPSDVSQDQINFGAFVTGKGYHWQVAFGWEQAVMILINYLKNVPYQVTPHQQTVHFRMMEKLNATSAS